MTIPLRSAIVTEPCPFLQFLAEPFQIESRGQHTHHIASIVPDGQSEWQHGMRVEPTFVEDRRIIAHDEALHTECIMEIGAIGIVVLRIDSAGRPATDMSADVHSNEG
jgi:hypothetical protein